MKLNKISKITGKIVLESGLHIGAGDTELRIGGTDNPVVKHPHTNEPYIPGSSLKGKVRSLLEMKSGLLALAGDGKPLETKILKHKDLKEDQRSEAERILKLFGVSGADDQENLKIGPARASFADSFLSEKNKKMIKANQQSYFEVKSENSINRIKGTAENPRFTERVVAGLKFDFAISLKEMEGDEDLLDTLLEGLKLLEHDALGGSGSRGYGRVHFEFDDKTISKKFAEIQLFS
ncbi:MAG: type III-A CRISPR-associated RAMP protein Csm3 [Deltaproteobacteria bacterium]|nr:type III-A CRISPR-associated RAMP protein Csm3 [Deltaproteobacteria bacterium]MBW1946821.1 type III-A CRISPR-associated RAMP protein Csm3 [Deltaproteobacteria bacterium]MBW1966772.1 type III-A CRISPR-associated RAMP protein Csm3 [Deltaproteobacteria bacterium]MBW2098544.1 type III-A CRISPR-associated RAMP protein Csm3 [Deltaproteobacteria bacterium]RLB18293.1 MAG: type III-A CRISPR-associated RAMP protein Csm3 [Deltaproteobacteria bacterium]